MLTRPPFVGEALLEVTTPIYFYEFEEDQRDQAGMSVLDMQFWQGESDLVKIQLRANSPACFGGINTLAMFNDVLLRGQRVNSML